MLKEIPAPSRFNVKYFDRETNRVKFREIKVNLFIKSEFDKDYYERWAPFELHLSAGSEDTIIVEEFDISLLQGYDEHSELGHGSITAPGIFFRRLNNEVFKKINKHYDLGLRLFKLNTKNKIPFVHGAPLNFTYDLTADIGSTMTVQGTVGLEYRRVSLEGSKSYSYAWNPYEDNNVISKHRGVALNYMATKRFSVSGFMEDARFDYNTKKGNTDIENPTAGIKVQYLFD